MDKDISILKEAVDKLMPGMVLNIVMDFGMYYVIGVDYKNPKDEDQLMDPYYAVDKKSFKLHGWSPMMDIDRYKIEIKRPVYKR